MEKQQENKLTKEEEIIDFIQKSENSVANKVIIEKFNISEDYLLSLKTRIKNKWIKIK